MASLERDRVPLARPIASKEVPLVDRVEELKLLKEAVERTVQGEGGLVFLYGEAGIGKTRLLRELGAYAQSHGMQVLHGRCPGLFRMDGVPPYVIWKEVIKDYLETCIPEQLYRVIGYYPAEVAKLVPELSQKLRTMPPSFPISPEQEQNRLFEAVSQFLTNLSREAPLLVVLDDLQWTDPSSLLLLHYLASGVQKTQLLILGAYRSTDVDAKHALTPILAELKRERLPKSVSLKRMSQEDTLELIRQVLEQDDIPQEFCGRVYEKTRGNPFFTEEVIESLKDEGLIYKENGRWNFKEISAIEFPESVKNVVKARISRLDDECQNVLTMASFVGNDFTLNAVCALTGIEENQLLEIMDRLLKTGLIKEREVHGEGICSFADILVRDIVYEEVSLLKRKKLHGLVGNALEKVYATKLDEHFAELASHFLESGDKGKALSYFLKAGDKAAGIYANEEAASYYRSALKLLEEKEGKLQEKEHVLERLGEVERFMGEYEACIKHWNEALSVLTKLDMKQEIAGLHRKMANVLWNWLGDKEKGKEHHEAALQILEAAPESVELARVYKDSGHRLRRMGDFKEALRLEEKALGIAERLNAQDVVAESCHELAIELICLGDFKKAQEYASRALKIALDNNYLEIALWAYDRVGGVFPWEEYEKRFDCFEKGLALAKKIGQPSEQCDFLLRQAHEYLHYGEFNKAIALTEEALSLARKIDGAFFISWAEGHLGQAYMAFGDWDKSERHIKEALNAAREIKEAPSVAGSYFEFGLLYFSKGEYAKAKASYEEAFRLQAGDKLDQMYTSWFLAWTCIELGNVDSAQGLLDDWHKFAFETNDKETITWEKELRAMLLRAQKKYAESIELFEETLQESEAVKSNVFDAYWFAQMLLLEYGRVYVERNEPEDKEKAAKLFNRALEMFQKMGAKKDIDRTLRLMEGLNPSSEAESSEKRISPACYVCEEVQGKVVTSTRELKIGESLELEIAVKNTSKEETILLTKVTGIIPESFAVVRKPELSLVDGDCLDIRDKRLEPLKTEIVKLVLTPKTQGTFQIRPKIIYLDEDGKEKTCELAPIGITIKELGLRGWLKGER